MARYIEVEKPQPKGPGGARLHPLMDKLSVPINLVDDPKERLLFRCIAAPNGCDRIYPSSRQRDRVFKHAAQDCPKMPKDLVQRANKELARAAPSVKAKESAQDAESARRVVAELELKKMTSEANLPFPSASASAAAGSTFAATTSVNPESAPSNSIKGFKPDGGLHAIAKEAGRRKIETERKERTDTLHVLILKFFVSAGIPLNAADSPHWKAIFKKLDRDFVPASRSTMEDSRIPREAAAVRLCTIEYLQTQDRLTASFDAGSIRSQASNLNCHVITEDGLTFLVEGKDASADSHTGDYYFIFLRDVRLGSIISYL